MTKYSLLLILSLFSYLTHAQLSGSQLKDIHGKTIQSENLFSNIEEPIVLCFWATWCRPCLQELEAINEAMDEWQDEVEFKMIAISTDNSRSSSKVSALVKAQDWQFDVYIDENSDLKRAINVSGIPFCCIINKGEVVWKHSGYQAGSEELILEKLTQLSKK
ncbi:TlpA family protein disulfide reductase [Ancylomarina euxinus]|uniref:TlpA family protein disulfide reductase n=1 Tax=Ancylomarina euxinus TaxID=2283627 RepID=A0A425Y2Q5_9BACT|nr:TlpA disulfide reductase family protein [Ancylomarina euxinus]MCZ4694852.1 TlpA disulfide reductase family protein [Ancylomarina euxinus]MUP14718.1 redoxin domain-containing protein [Ancylomarina euxinus]RRG22068.1 TlpA family protein disulfide reductase [Ancylomarina euxinus]